MNVLLKQDDQHIIVTNKLIILYISTNFYIITAPKPSTHVGGMAERKAGTITLAPWHFFTRSGSNISFRIASLSMRATRCEKRHVEKDSCRRLKKNMLQMFVFLCHNGCWHCHLTSRFPLSTAMVAIIVVIQLPPRLSLNTDVSREFLYGIWGRFGSDSAMIT